MAAKQNRNISGVKRGRPPNIARRESILSVAETLFVKHGFDGATMHEIAATAGITDSLLYRYYRDKPSILDALAQRALAMVDEFIAQTQTMLADGSGKKQIFRLAQQYSQFVERMRSFYMLWFMGPERFEPYAAIASERAAEFYSLVDASLESSTREGHLPAGARTRVFSSAIFGFTFMYAQLGRPLEPATRNAFLEEMTLRFGG